MKHILVARSVGEFSRWWMALAIVLIVLMSACGDDRRGRGGGVLDDAGGVQSDAGNVLDDAGGVVDGADGVGNDGGGVPSDCANGTFDHDGDPATACVAWSDCDVGSYVTSAPSATSDRVCGACASGTFTTMPNQSSCTAWRDCAQGMYVSVAGSAQADRQCTSCAPGTNTSAPNQSKCIALGECAAGTEQLVPKTDTEAAVCKDCEACTAGTYCAGGTTSAKACASGTWDHDNNPATACVAWKICAAGESVVSNGSATSNRTCRACASGMFSTDTNAASCSAWTRCAAGSHVSTAGSATGDRVCKACSTGSYTSTSNQSTCLAHTTCAAGTKVVTAGSTTTNRVCSACESGTYTASTNSDNCLSWDTCEIGSYVEVSGTNKRNRQCTVCPEGETTTTTDAPVCEADLGSVVQIAAGYTHTCSLHNDGRVKCWGNNDSGQLGDGTTTNRRTPEVVPGVSNAVQIAISSYGTCALLDDGAIQCWGYNGEGLVGDGTYRNRHSPTDVLHITDAVEIAMGSGFACARLSDDTVKCWGDNEFGQLGDGRSNYRVSSPTQVLGLSNVAQLALGGSYACALLSTNKVKCWGYNNYGVLGTGAHTLSQLNSPSSYVKSASFASGELENVVGLTAGTWHACAEIGDGSVQCWGRNHKYQLGDGTAASERTVAIPSTNISGGTGLTAGLEHTCGLFANGVAKCVGGNEYGELGNGETAPRRHYMVVVSGLTDAVELSAGWNYTCARFADGSAKCWGANGYGKLGDGTSTSRSTPVLVDF